jgi:serine/threonine protein kinase
VVHGDVKPGNVLFSPRLGPEALKLVDFGIAHLSIDARSRNEAGTSDDDGLPTSAARHTNAASDTTQTAVLRGTPEYMAPEMVANGFATATSDIYALGVVAYELMVGQRPFAGSIGALVRQHRDDTPPRPSQLAPSLPRELDAALLAPLEKAPDRRPKTA